jgi:CRISPR system Cascade subunit CasA
MRDRLASVDAAEAAQAVVHCMAFDFSGIKPGADGDKRVKGGKGYPIGIGWCGWLGGTVIEGKNLRETLLLNYIPLRPGAGTEDRPLWEMEDIGAGSEGRSHRAGACRTADLAAAQDSPALGRRPGHWCTGHER